MVTLDSSDESLMGLSTDVKPINVSTNTLFIELDTKKFFYFDGGAWKPVGGPEESE